MYVIINVCYSSGLRPLAVRKFFNGISDTSSDRESVTTVRKWNLRTSSGQNAWVALNSVAPFHHHEARLFWVYRANKILAHQQENYAN